VEVLFHPEVEAELASLRRLESLETSREEEEL
jgi:hypothetical protein